MPTSSASRRRFWSVRTLLGCAVLCGLLLALTVWAATRSEALEAARAAYQKRDFVLARTKALEHLKRRPWSHAAAVLAARSLSEGDRADEAEPYYRRALRLGGLSLDDQHVRAFGLIVAVHPDQAIAVYEEVLRRWPDDKLALRRLAAIYYSRKQTNEARAVAERLCQVPGGAVVGYALLGSILHDNHQTAEAIAAYEKVLALDPELRSLPIAPWIFWSELTRDLIDSGRADDARRLLIEALTRHDDAELQYERGLAEESLGAMDEAEACWLRAVERDPKLARAWRSLGRWELKRRQPERALEFLTRAAALDPEDDQAAYSLGLAYRQLGRSREAAEYSRRAERLRAAAARPRVGMGTP